MAVRLMFSRRADGRVGADIHVVSALSAGMMLWAKLPVQSALMRPIEFAATTPLPWCRE
jgi:hypothetical protein